MRPRSSTIARLTSWCSERSSSFGDGSFQLTGFGAGPTGMASWTTSVGASSAVGHVDVEGVVIVVVEQLGVGEHRGVVLAGHEHLELAALEAVDGLVVDQLGEHGVGLGLAALLRGRLVVELAVEDGDAVVGRDGGGVGADLEERVDAAAHDALGGLHAVGGLLGRGAHRDAGGHDQADHGEGDEHEAGTPRARAGSSSGPPTAMPR